MRKTTRRTMLKTAAAAATVAALPINANAQSGEPIKIGILTPLTGAGGNDGPRMQIGRAHV